jgi:hypothetical protein
MLIRRIIAVTLLAALFIAIVYFCVSSFTTSLKKLEAFKAYAERLEVLTALLHLVVSISYLFLSIIMLLFIGILVYLIIALLLNNEFT